MLKQRIITALILAPLALYAILFLPIFWFEIAIAGVVGIGAYEGHRTVHDQRHQYRKYSATKHHHGGPADR